MPAKDVVRAIRTSRNFEMQTYINEMSKLYQNSVTQNGMLFDLAMSVTKEFSAITPEAIVADSRIVKILRFCVSPSISQMKFGQLFGLPTIERFEAEKLVGGAGLVILEDIAPQIARFVADHFDKDRFLWLTQKMSEAEKALAERYAKSWTCSLIADQNAQTAYRNWRKTLQETRIEAALIPLGYTRSEYRGTVAQQSDINVGTYLKECRVRGRTVQKADLVVHQRDGNRLVLIEAKAIGVQLDAYKRVKECCDKAGDWGANKSLGPAGVVAVVAGFLTETNLETLKASGVHVVWEHAVEEGIAAILESPLSGKRRRR